jgi:hypothetical protein
VRIAIEREPSPPRLLAGLRHRLARSNNHPFMLFGRLRRYYTKSAAMLTNSAAII